MTNAVQQKKEQRRTLVQLIEAMQPSIAVVLPRHLTPERMVRLAILAIYKTPELRECDPNTVLSAIMQASQLGLEIGRHAHLVPFYNQRAKRKECVMIPDYRGIADLVYRATGIVVDARLVYEGDYYEYEEGTSPKIVHRPSSDAQRDPDHVVAAYMIARFPDGRVKQDWMWRDELDAIWQRSRAKDSGPWQTDRCEMYRKTVVKRGAKLLPQSPELAEAIELDNRFESGDLGHFTRFDDPESVQQAVVEKTQEKTDALRQKLEGVTSVDPAAGAKGGQEGLLF